MAYARALVDFVLANQARLEAPLAALQAAQAQAQAVALMPPLAEATRARNAVHDQYIPAVDAGKAEPSRAQGVLYRAERPGLDEATRLKRKLRSVESDISGYERDVSSAKREISSLKSRISREEREEEPSSSMIMLWKSQIRSKESEIRSLESKIRSKESEASRLKRDVRYEESRRNPPDHPEVVAATQLVAAAQARLDKAQAAYDAAMAGPTARRDEEQRIYDEKMAVYREKVSRLQGEVDQFLKPRDEAIAAFGQLGEQVGGFKRLWWRVFHGVDFKDVLAEQAARMQPGKHLTA